jgi:hypothetical protein
MLTRNRSPEIESRPVDAREGLEHVRPEWVALLRWLHENRVEYILVGGVAAAIRGQLDAGGPVAIVPAPYRRNLDRLSRALSSAHARLRVDGEADTAAVRMTPEKLVGGARWPLRCGVHDLDIEARPAGVPRYQELLYEAGSFELEPALKVEVASPEDLEHFAHAWRSGADPEIKITRAAEGAEEPRAS